VAENKKIKGLTQRVSESFNDDQHEDSSQYIDWVSAAIVSRSQSLRRMVTLIVLLIAAFEVVNESPRTQLTLGSFQLSKGSVVIQFVPVLVSFFYFQSIIDSAKLNKTQRALSAVFNKWSSQAGSNRLDNFIIPPMPIFWNIGGTSLGGEQASFSSKIALAASAIFMAIFLLGIPAFQVQAYYALYWSPVGNIVLWYISVSMTVIFTAAGAAYFFGEFTAEYPD